MDQQSGAYLTKAGRLLVFLVGLFLFLYAIWRWIM